MKYRVKLGNKNTWFQVNYTSKPIHVSSISAIQLISHVKFPNGVVLNVLLLNNILVYPWSPSSFSIAFHKIGK